MFKVIVNLEHIQFDSSVSIVNFEQVNFGWVDLARMNDS